MPSIQPQHTHHLETRLKELNKQYELLSAKILRLREALAISASVAQHFEIEKQIELAEAERDTINKEIEDTEAQLSGLASLKATGFDNLAQVFYKTSSGIRNRILDYTSFIEEKTRGFVGRQFIFDAVDQFVRANPRGYFFIRGEPGIGKSALAAQMVKTKGYVHHFNLRAGGIYRAVDFLESICAQLIAAYNLPYNVLPPETTRNADFVSRLFKQVSEKLEPGRKVVIVVDALDEVDTTGLVLGVNPLYLPPTLPRGIYVVVTIRTTSR